MNAYEQKNKDVIQTLEKDTSTTDKCLQAEALTREIMPSITHMCPPSLTRGNDVLDARQRKDYHSS